MKKYSIFVTRLPCEHVASTLQLAESSSLQQHAQRWFRLHFSQTLLKCSAIIISFRLFVAAKRVSLKTTSPLWLVSDALWKSRFFVVTRRLASWAQPLRKAKITTISLLNLFVSASNIENIRLELSTARPFFWGHGSGPRVYALISSKHWSPQHSALLLFISDTIKNSLSMLSVRTNQHPKYNPRWVWNSVRLLLV